MKFRKSLLASIYMQTSLFSVVSCVTSPSKDETNGKNEHQIKEIKADSVNKQVFEKPWEELEQQTSNLNLDNVSYSNLLKDFIAKNLKLEQPSLDLINPLVYSVVQSELKVYDPSTEFNFNRYLIKLKNDAITINISIHADKVFTEKIHQKAIVNKNIFAVSFEKMRDDISDPQIDNQQFKILLRRFLSYDLMLSSSSFINSNFIRHLTWIATDREEWVVHLFDEDTHHIIPVSFAAFPPIPEEKADKIYKEILIYLNKLNYSYKKNVDFWFQKLGVDSLLPNVLINQLEVNELISSTSNQNSINYDKINSIISSQFETIYQYVKLNDNEVYEWMEYEEGNIKEESGLSFENIAGFLRNYEHINLTNLFSSVTVGPAIIPIHNDVTVYEVKLSLKPEFVSKIQELISPSNPIVNFYQYVFASQIL